MIISTISRARIEGIVRRNHLRRDESEGEGAAIHSNPFHATMAKTLFVLHSAQLDKTAFGFAFRPAQTSNMVFCVSLNHTLPLRVPWARLFILGGPGNFPCGFCRADFDF